MLVADDDDDFELFKMLRGGRHEPLLVGTIPPRVASRLRWPIRRVYLSRQTAQKIVCHTGHPTSLADAMRLKDVISQGDIAQDNKKDNLLFLKRKLNDCGKVRYYFIAAALDGLGQGIFVRTMFVRDISKKRLSKMTFLLKRELEESDWRNLCQWKLVA